MFCPSTEHGTTTWRLALILLPSVALADSGRVVARPAQTFHGWGMSLAWEANDLYGGGRQPAQIRDPGIQSQYMDLLFGDPAARLTLGFTIARYNIAGGDDPTHRHMRADAQMEGFQSGPDAPFDWTRDAPQRRMLREAKKRGAHIFEAASYSPPYWMTFSGCSSGANEWVQWAPMAKTSSPQRASTNSSPSAWPDIMLPSPKIANRKSISEIGFFRLWCLCQDLTPEPISILQ